MLRVQRTLARLRVGRAGLARTSVAVVVASLTAGLGQVAPGAADSITVGDPVVTATVHGQQIFAGPTENVTFSCQATATQSNDKATGITACYIVGLTFGDVYCAPASCAAVFQSGPSVEVTRTVSNAPTQGYEVCAQGQVFNKDGSYSPPNPPSPRCSTGVVLVG